jgi:uncharacterized membrane protein YqgA involved in biofilm formation
MIGTLVNALTVVVGGMIGLLLKERISNRISTIFFQAIGLFTLLLGIRMALQTEHVIVLIASLVTGAFVGESMHLDQKIDQTGNYLKAHFKVRNDKFSEGIITAFLLFCTGSMTIIGSIQEGMGQGHDLLFTKALMDGFSSILLAAGFGISIPLVAIPLFLFQGSLTLLAYLFGSYFSMPIINELTATGGILLMGLSINILEIKKLKVINMIPSLLFVCLFMWITLHFNLK